MSSFNCVVAISNNFIPYLTQSCFSFLTKTQIYLAIMNFFLTGSKLYCFQNHTKWQTALWDYDLSFEHAPGNASLFHYCDLLLSSNEHVKKQSPKPSGTVVLLFIHRRCPFVTVWTDWLDWGWNGYLSAVNSIIVMMFIFVFLLFFSSGWCYWVLWLQSWLASKCKLCFFGLSFVTNVCCDQCCCHQICLLGDISRV